MATGMINLIPPRIKKQQAMKRLTAIVSTAMLSIVVMSLIVLGAIYAVDSIVKSELAISEQNLADSELKIKSLTDIESRINAVNGKLTRLDGLKKKSITWTDVMSKFNAAVPEKVQITSMQMDTTSSKFTLNGLAPSRREIVMLQTKLEDSDYFSGVTFGSSTLNTTNNSFTFSLTGEFKK